MHQEQRAFISADDIAAAAGTALTRENSFNSHFVLTGRRPLTYDEIAQHTARLSAARFHTVASAPKLWRYAIRLGAWDRNMFRRWRRWMRLSWRVRRIEWPVV